MSFIKNTFKGIGKAALDVGKAFIYSPKRGSSMDQKGKDGIFAERFFDKKTGRASMNDFTNRFKKDSGGEFYNTTKFGREKREELLKEITEGMKKTPGALKYNNLHSEDFEKALKQFKMGKYGAYKDFFAPGKEKERKELEKSLQAFSKTVPL
jgi:hypothetical protein